MVLSQVVSQHQESFYYVDNMNANLMNQQTAQLPIASGTNNMIQAAKSENLKTKCILAHLTKYKPAVPDSEEAHQG